SHERRDHRGARGDHGRRNPRILQMIERLLPYRRAVLLAAHVVLMTAAYLLAFLLRFEFPLPPESLELFVKTLPVLLVIRMAVFAWFHLHHSLWRYVSM